MDLNESCRIHKRESCATCEAVEGDFTFAIVSEKEEKLSHDTHVNESRLHIWMWMSYVAYRNTLHVPYLKRWRVNSTPPLSPRRRRKWVATHTWMSHDTHMNLNESCRIYEWDACATCKAVEGDFTFAIISKKRRSMNHVTNMNESRFIYECDFSNVQKNRPPSLLPMNVQLPMNANVIWLWLNVASPFCWTFAIVTWLLLNVTSATLWATVLWLDCRWMWLHRLYRQHCVLTFAGCDCSDFIGNSTVIWHWLNSTIPVDGNLQRSTSVISHSYFAQLLSQNVVLTMKAIPSYQKTAIFPETRKGNMHSSNESARGWSLSEANVKVSTRSALHDGQDTEKTIWFKRAWLAKSATTFSRRTNL